MVGIETSHNCERAAGEIAITQMHVKSTDTLELVQFACRYINKNSPSKNQTPGELQALSNAKIRIVTVWENGYPTEQGYKDGYFTRARGNSDARAAFEMAQTLGQPDGMPIYFAVDFDGYTSAHRKAIIEYLRGIEGASQDLWSEIHEEGKEPFYYPIGLYGSAYVLDWAMSEGLAQYFWQAFAHGWSGGENKKPWVGANLHTIDYDLKCAGVPCELVLACTPDDFGGWSL